MFRQDLSSHSLITFFFLSQDQEVDESGDEVTGDHIQASQTNGADEWVTHLN